MGLTKYILKKIGYGKLHKRKYTFSKADRERAEERREQQKELKDAEFELRKRRVQIKGRKYDLEEAKIEAGIRDFDEEEQQPQYIQDAYDIVSNDDNDIDGMTENLLKMGMEAFNNAKDTGRSGTRVVSTTSETRSTSKGTKDHLEED